MRDTSHLIEIGKRMRQALDEAGLTPEEVARRIGTSGPTVYRWITGQSRTSVERMDAFAAAVGRSRLWLEFGPAAVDYLAEGFRLWADAIAAGVDPGQALTAATSMEGKIDPPLMERLIQSAPRLIATLEDLAGGGWETLTPAAKEEAARKLVQALDIVRPLLP